jgi:hypothetical protein
MSATSRILDHVHTPRIQERLGETCKMHHDAPGNFLDVYLEIVKLHHAISAEISVADLVLRAIDTRDLAADNRRDFQVLHFQRSLRVNELNHHRKLVRLEMVSRLGVKVLLLSGQAREHANSERQQYSVCINTGHVIGGT